MKNGSEYKIKPEDETVWTITDVTLYGDHYLLSFIIENEKGIQLNLPVADENKWFYSSEKVDEYKQLYGGFYKNILKKTVKIGMPKEALEIAWGKPDKINRSSYGSDQWVYNGQYVYIENGKVKSWN